jgi:hypothetical protein
VLDHLFSERGRLQDGEGVVGIDFRYPPWRTHQVLLNEGPYQVFRQKIGNTRIPELTPRYNNNNSDL